MGVCQKTYFYIYGKSHIELIRIHIYSSSERNYRVCVCDIIFTQLMWEWSAGATWDWFPWDVTIHHYSDVIMAAMTSQINSLTIVYSTVYSGADQRKHQSSASLAFVRGIHR